MNLAIMQPYFFPYIGYFQLINAVEKFVFYDDVQFIKGGWINRNYILEKGERRLLITLNLEHASPNKKINEIRVKDNSKKLIKTIEQNYSRAPFFDQAFPVIQEILRFSSDMPLISEIASFSIYKISKYLGLKTDFVFSSKNYPETLNHGQVDRLISICRTENAENYINLLGGKEIYSKQVFKEQSISLFFIKMKKIQYDQRNKEFIPNLSIIDVVMYNSKLQTLNLLNNYELG